MKTEKLKGVPLYGDAYLNNSDRVSQNAVLETTSPLFSMTEYLIFKM
jgi:hypothetical protein